MPSKPQEQCTHPMTVRIGASNLQKCLRCLKVRYVDYERKEAPESVQVKEKADG